METKILIVEDDNDINNLIFDTLSQRGYECIQSFSGTEAMLYLDREEFALIILDIMLPGISGEELIKRIKPQISAPVIIVSAIDELDSKVDLLTLGADDYITKPFEIKELVARAEVQLRKSNAGIMSKDLTHKGLFLNKDNYRVTLNGKDITVTRQEFKILELLLSNPRKVFSKQDIYTYAWDDYYIGEDKTINVHISNIRQKLKAVSEEEYIETVWGVGFKLSE